MANAVSNNIIRYAGETMPSKSVIKLQGVPLDVSDDWRIEVRYKVPPNTVLPGGYGIATVPTELVIDAVIVDSHNGKFNIYPHARMVGDEPLTPDKYITSEVRDKLIEANDGSEDGVPYVNQVWDDDEVAAVGGGGLEYPFYIVRIKDYDSSGCDKCYREEQVHNVGMIQIASRWLK